MAKQDRGFVVIDSKSERSFQKMFWFMLLLWYSLRSRALRPRGLWVSQKIGWLMGGS